MNGVTQLQWDESIAGVACAIDGYWQGNVRQHNYGCDDLHNGCDWRVLLLGHIEAVGWDRIARISEDCRSLGLRTGDSSTLFILSFSVGYPRDRPIISGGLFPNQAYFWDGSKDLAYMLNLYHASAAQYQDFFQALQDFDGRISVEENNRCKSTHNPTVNYSSKATPTPSSSTQSSGTLLVPSPAVRAVPLRSSALGPVWAEFTFRPDKAGQAPDLRLYGSGLDDNALAESWENYQWDSRQTILSNLEGWLGYSILQVKEMQQPVSAALVVDGACAICYSQKVSSDTATQKTCADDESMVHCKNKRCRCSYHSACARGWLLTTPTCHVSFGILFGNCPYCGSSIELPLM